MVSPGWAGELLPPLGRCVLSESQDSLIHLHNLPGPMDVWASLGAQMVKRLPAMEETGFDPWVRKIPWRRKWQPTAVFLPEESHGQRSLVGYSPCGHKESDTTERLHFLSFFLWMFEFETPDVVSKCYE